MLCVEFVRCVDPLKSDITQEMIQLNRFLRFRNPANFRISDHLFLLIPCLSGLLTGTAFATTCCDQLSSLMLRLPQVPLSIIGAVSVWLLPLTVSWIVTLVNKRLVYIVAFFKSFGLALCMGLITCAFAEAGWLMRLCLMFTDLCAYPILCGFWLCAAKHGVAKGSIAAAVIVLLLISLIDTLCIWPMIVRL